ncbi:MAG: PASTA domain-containing protein [Clostridiales Family XIII bacterium]|jgi:hypothetical protein|nr:PASTA domain-containing protein [Clostridiales Family XIII bacterium]
MKTKIRKALSAALSVALALTVFSAAAPGSAAAPNVVPSRQNLTLDGVAADVFNAYNIDGNNYFKLRDVALLLGDRFSVGYTKGVITLTTGSVYEPDGSESVGKAGAFSEIIPSNDAVFVNGYETGFDAYKIDGSNYYKLRDLGAMLEFGVAYNEASDTVELTKAPAPSTGDPEASGLSRQTKQLSELTSEEIEEYNEGLSGEVVSDKEKQAAVDAKIDEVIARYIRPGMSDLDKERVIHDWLIINTTYGVCGNIASGEHTPYNLVIMGHGVCSAYARTMKLFMDELGIPCEYVSGYPVGGGTGHAWNRVQIGGVWYELDVTWDEPQTLGGGASLAYEVYSPYSREKLPSGNYKWPDTRFAVEYTYFNRATKGFSHGAYIRDEDATQCKTNMPQETVLNAATLPGRALELGALRGGGPGSYDDDYSDYMYPERHPLFFADMQNLTEKLVSMGVRRDALPVYDADQKQVSVLDVTTRQYMRATLECLQYLKAENIPFSLSYEYYTGKPYTCKYMGGISSSRPLEFGELPIGYVASPSRYFILEGDTNTLIVNLTISMGAQSPGAAQEQPAAVTPETEGANSSALLVAPDWNSYFSSVLAPGETQKTFVSGTSASVYDMKHYAEEWVKAGLDAATYANWRDTLVTLRYSYSSSVPAGRIISQSPASGEPVDFNKGIQITASLGPKTVPDFVGLTLDEAEEMQEYLKEQRHIYISFSHGSDGYKYSDAYPAAGTIWEQSPSAGAPINTADDYVHASVRLSLSLGALPLMPDVTGLDIAGAYDRIREADNLRAEGYKSVAGGYQVNMPVYYDATQEEYSDLVPEDRIISTSPAAGERCDLNDKNFKVTFVISKGPRPVSE